MTRVEFRYSGDKLCGFTISGHSGYAEEGEDIVCAAISSAALMTANTVTEIRHINAEITQDDGFLSLDLSGDEAAKADDLLAGLQLHLTLLSKEYPQFITVNNSEV